MAMVKNMIFFKVADFRKIKLKKKRPIINLKLHQFAFSAAGWPYFLYVFGVCALHSLSEMFRGCVAERGQTAPEDA